MNSQWPLRYRISDWRQLKDCKSNNSKDLKISTTVFVNTPQLNGLRIRIEHPTFGILFSTIVDPKGSLTSKTEEGYVFQMTPGQILEELAKWGFLVEYLPMDNLSGNQIQYLMTLQGLHYDKIRVLSVWDAPLGVKEFKVHVVAFQSDKLGNWLNAGYSPSKSEYLSALDSGYTINVSSISNAENYDWSWLYNWVANISDILADYTGTNSGR